MASPSPGFFIEVGHAQERKQGQAACGDVFLSQKADGGGRIISVLADGLGSGIKASVLANLTATMALRYAAAEADLTHAAATILASLPVCSERRIAYSTFTIVDVEPRGEVRVVEYDNPPFLLLRQGRPVAVPRTEHRVPTPEGQREAVLREARFLAEPGDRIVVCSDGVSQAGVGARATPFGWGMEAAGGFLEGLLKERPGISARQMARSLAQKALLFDGRAAKDDITAGVFYLRKPRELMLFTGAPAQKARDGELAELARAFAGRKVACGGTTAGILARELGLKLEARLDELDPEVPPEASMAGFDLVTEGAITLAVTTRLLEREEGLDQLRPNAATRLAGLLLDSDLIHIVAGTKINEALQDPSLPQELDIRRNLVRRLQRVLSEKHLKDVRVRFL